MPQQRHSLHFIDTSNSKRPEPSAGLPETDTHKLLVPHRRECSVCTRMRASRLFPRAERGRDGWKQLLTARRKEQHIDVKLKGPIIWKSHFPRRNYSRLSLYTGFFTWNFAAVELGPSWCNNTLFVTVLQAKLKKPSTEWETSHFNRNVIYDSRWKRQHLKIHYSRFPISKMRKVHSLCIYLALLRHKYATERSSSLCEVTVGWEVAWTSSVDLAHSNTPNRWKAPQGASSAGNCPALPWRPMHKQLAASWDTGGCKRDGRKGCNSQ